METAVFGGASSAAAIVGGTTRLRCSPAPTNSASFLLLPSLPSARPSSLPLLTASPFLPESRRFSNHQVRAGLSEESSESVEDIVSDLKNKWEALENKPTVILYAGGAVVAVWLSSIVIGAINSVPLLPKIMELVGLGYTGWFVYRYLLFKSSRKELATDIEDLKRKIAGTGE